MAKFVRGLEDVAKRLKTFAPELARRHLLRATLAGSNLIKSAVEGKAPEMTGLLKKSIVIAAPFRKRPLSVTDIIRITDKYWSPGDVGGPGHQKAFTVTRGKNKGKKVSFFARSKETPPSGYAYILERGFVKRGRRGRVRARRFFRDAFYSKREKAVDAIAAALRLGVEDTAKRLGGGR
jgi:hypothetical protein